MLREALGRAVRDAARGAEPAPWLGGRALAEWAVLWDMLGRLAIETEALNLDRKQAVLTGLAALAVPRGGG